MSKRYFVNLRTEAGWTEIRKSEFDRLRRFSVFELRSKGTRLRLKKEYLGWRTDDGEMRFQEKLTGIVTRYIPSPEDSCARVERLCSAQNPQFIRDEVERTREIARQYA